MRSSIPLCFIVFATIAATSSAQQKLSSILPTEETAARHGLVRQWYGFAPVDGVREVVQRAMVVGNQVHLQTNASRIHVMHGETGKVLWSAQLGLPIPGQFGSAVNSDSVFVINGSELYRLSREDGSMLWSLRLPQAANAAPAADEGRVMVSTLDGRVYIYNIHSKELMWFYQTGGSVSMPAALLDDKIACASQDGKMYVFQSASRNPMFRYETDKPVSAPMSVWGRYVLIASQDFNVYSVDVRTGDTAWRYSSGSDIRQPLTIIENDVFVTPEGSGLHVIDAETGPVAGRPKWWHPRAEDFVTASANRVYATDKFGQLLTLDRSNGRQLGIWDTHNFDYHVRNESNDRLYLATKTGMVVCLREKENKQPVEHKKVLPPSPAGIDVRKPAAGKAAAAK